MKQSIYLLGFILLGAFIPGAYFLSFMIRYNLMVMLFLTFINTPVPQKILQKENLLVLGLNVALPLLIWLVFRHFHTTAALACLVTGIAPTAAAAPMMARFLKLKETFILTSLLISSFFISLILPFLLPVIVEVNQPINSMEMLAAITLTVFFPFVLSFAIRWSSADLTKKISSLSKASFYFYLANVFLATSNACHYILTTQELVWWDLFLILLFITIQGLLLFRCGALIKNRGFSEESSLALGHKNTMYSIWLATNFLGPMIALGPMFHIVFQNTYNSWQLYKKEKK